VTAVLAILMVILWGSWIPIAQATGGVSQRQRTFYVTVGNLVIAIVALTIGGGHLTLGWREFWLPFAGGIVWTLGNYTAFRGAENIGLARASGTWSPLNIIVSFTWGILLFHELRGFSAIHFAVLGVALVFVVIGVLLIVRSQEEEPLLVPAGDGTALTITKAPSRYGVGLRWALAAGFLWGSYFVPAQWAKVPSQVSNVPLAIGMLAASVVLTVTAGDRLAVRPKAAGILTFAGTLFGIGDVLLLVLVKRIGTGSAFTIGQLSILISASVGIWVFKVPRPGSRAARRVAAGVVAAGIGGTLIGALK
jgi:glucose uptake protein